MFGFSLPAIGDPIPAFQFTVIISHSSTIWGYFTEVNGLGDQQDVIDYKYFSPSSKRDEVIKVLGRWSPPQVTFKRGVTTDMGFWEWRDNARNAYYDTLLYDVQATIWIIMHNRTHIPTAVWEMTNAWPSKISGPELSTESSAIGVEEVVVECEGFERVDLGLLGFLLGFL